MSRRSIVLFTIVVGVAMLVALVAFEAGRSEYRGVYSCRSNHRRSRRVPEAGLLLGTRRLRFDPYARTVPTPIVSTYTLLEDLVPADIRERGRAREPRPSDHASRRLAVVATIVCEGSTNA